MNHHAAAPAPVALRTRDVADLTIASGYPCISVLLPTEPGPRLSPHDLKQLHQLVAEVEARLREAGVLSIDRLMHKLGEEVQRAAGQTTDRALAIYVSLAQAAPSGSGSPSPRARWSRRPSPRSHWWPHCTGCPRTQYWSCTSPAPTCTPPPTAG